MPQIHFFEVRDETGGSSFVRADRVEVVEERPDGLVLHTPSGAINAKGATRATLEADMKSGGCSMVMVRLNPATAPYSPPASPTDTPNPDSVSEEAPAPAPPAPRTRRKAVAPVYAEPALDPAEA